MFVKLTPGHVPLSDLSDRLGSLLVFHHVHGCFIYDFVSVQGLIKLSMLVLILVCLINFIFGIEGQSDTVHFHIIENFKFI
jgi:hypothetical protein